MRIKGTWTGSIDPDQIFGTNISSRIKKSSGETPGTYSILVEICGTLKRTPTEREIQLAALHLYHRLAKPLQKSKEFRSSMLENEIEPCWKNHTEDVPKDHYPLKTLEHTDWWNHLPNAGDPEIRELLKYPTLSHAGVPELWLLLLLQKKVSLRELKAFISTKFKTYTEILNKARTLSFHETGKTSGKKMKPDKPDFNKGKNPTYWTGRSVKKELRLLEQTHTGKIPEKFNGKFKQIILLNSDNLTTQTKNDPVLIKMVWQRRAETLFQEIVAQMKDDNSPTAKENNQSIIQAIAQSELDPEKYETIFPFPQWFQQPGRRTPTPEELDGWIQHTGDFLQQAEIINAYQDLIENLALPKILRLKNREVDGITVCIRILVHSLWISGNLPTTWITEQARSFGKILSESNERIRDETLQRITQNEILLHATLTKKNKLGQMLRNSLASQI
jgi:hypothetical protein